MALFIGGPLDGRLIEVDPARTFVEVAVEHELTKMTTQKPTKLRDMFYYKREILECPTEDIAVFVPRSYNCSHVIRTLINGYHQNAQHNDEE